MKDKIKQLNSEFYQILYDLKENKEALGTQKFYDFMLKKLFELYEKEYERLYVSYEVEVRREVFENRARAHYMIPHVSWFFGLRNKSAKLIDQKIEYEAERFFKETEAMLDAMLKAEMKKAGVNDLSGQAASVNVAATSPADLPISTLQACDELIKYAAENAPPETQKPRKQGSRGSDHPDENKPKSRKTGKRKKNKKEIPNGKS